MSLTLDQVKEEMQLKGWSYSEVTHDGVVYPLFEIGQDPDWTHTPLYSFYYSRREEGHWRLRKGLSQWAIASWDDPLENEDLVEMWGFCSRYA